MLPDAWIKDWVSEGFINGLTEPLIARSCT